MMNVDLELKGSAAPRTQVEEVVYRRAMQDGLARTPSTIDPTLARSAPGLARAYADGYQWGARHRSRLPTLLGKLRLGRRGEKP